MKHKLVIAMTAATLFLVGCGQRQHTEQVTLVRIDTVKTANTCDILEFPARVQAAGEVHLAFKIPGTLQRIYVDDGAFVRQGELVAEMDPRDYELQLQAVEAEYLSIKAEAERVMALYDQNVATADAYDKARYGLQQITAKYENARNQLADTKLYAPFDGYVKRRRFDPPTVVAAGMPVITFLSGKNPEVELFIPASTYIRRREIASFAAVFDFLQGQKISAATMFYEVYDSIQEDKFRLPAALFAQYAHLKSDVFTERGLPIPLLDSFSPELAGKLYSEQYDALCLAKDAARVGSQAVFAIFINMLISLLHGFFYNPQKDHRRDFYEVRTRKILLYSNAISSSINLAYVGVNAYSGNVGEALKKLDLGGLLVTLWRLFSDIRFITKVKEQFINEELDKVTANELKELDKMFQ